MAGTVFGARAQDQTQADLAKMRAGWAEVADPKDVEPTYIYAAFSAETPMDRGNVYQDMVSLFAGKGAHKYSAEIQKWADKAQEQPFQPMDMAEMYVNWANGIIDDSPHGADGAAMLSAADRDEAAEHYLQGLKTLLNDLNLGETAAADSDEGPASVTARERNDRIAQRDACLASVKDLYGADIDEVLKMKSAVSKIFGKNGDAIRVAAVIQGKPIPEDADKTAAAEFSTATPTVALVGPGAGQNAVTLSLFAGAVLLLAGGGYWKFRKPV
jgi:hypothetical protein